jgi:hypothetical protein
MLNDILTKFHLGRNSKIFNIHPKLSILQILRFDPNYHSNMINIELFNFQTVMMMEWKKDNAIVCFQNNHFMLLNQESDIWNLKGTLRS